MANKGDQSLGIIDPASGEQVGAVAEGGVTGHEVIASPDGKLAYVPIYGDSGVGKPGSDGGNLVVIDIAARKIVGNLDFGKGVRPLRKRLSALTVKRLMFPVTPAAKSPRSIWWIGKWKT